MKNRVHPELREMFSVLPEVDNSPENFQQYRKWAKESFMQQFYYRMMKLLYLIDLYQNERAPEVRVRIYEPTKNKSFTWGPLDTRWWISSGITRNG